MTKKAIIIGAGIAGPAMAIQLKRMGIEPQIFEARKESEMGEGVFLGITPNGLNALKEYIDLSLLYEEYTPGKMVFHNASNKAIGVLDTCDQLKTYGAETIQIKRSSIGNLLRQEAQKLGITIHFDHKLSDLHEAEDHVKVSFTNWREYCADFLIACDGTHSKCRQILFPNAPKPVYTKQLSTGVMASLNGASLSFGAINMIFGKKAFFAYAVSNKDEVWWFNNFYREKEPSKEEVQTILQKEIQSQLLQIHKNDPAPIVDIIRRSDQMFVYPIYEMPELHHWHTRSICLIGDAAHATAPHIGQGASLALEDTVVIAQCLQRYDTLENAFSHFQNLRKPRVDKIVKQARKVGNTKSQPNPVATFFRDLLLKHFIQMEKKKLAWVYAYKAN